MSRIGNLIDQYRDWLGSNITDKPVDNGWTEITTPFLDRHNDQIQIYVKLNSDGLFLTDDGYTLIDLEQSGCQISTPKRQSLLKTILNGFGVRQERGALTIQATEENFPLRKHNLIQAILAVNDLFYLATSTVKSLFLEDVADWLDLHDIRYIPQTKLPGASGYDHMFDFAIPKSRKTPERLLRAVNDPARSKAENFAFAWYDTRETRPAGALAYAVLNDDDRAVPRQTEEALKAYGINSIPWSGRDGFREALAS